MSNIDLAKYQDNKMYVERLNLEEIQNIKKLLEAREHQLTAKKDISLFGYKAEWDNEHYGSLGPFEVHMRYSNNEYYELHLGDVVVACGTIASCEEQVKSLRDDLIMATTLRRKKKKK